MESNTYATSTFIAAPEADAFAYLRDLRNLDEWTLYSRMIEQLDENTWRGTASGYQHDLYYHVRTVETPRFRGVEWHCGYEYNKYFQCYPAILFPPGYLGSDEAGVYFHWLAFVGPERRTQMLMQGIHLVHTAEIRSLKAALERKAGVRAAARGSHDLQTDSIFVDAPLSLAAPYLGDVRNYAAWAFFIRPHGAADAHRGTFLDEYDRVVEVSAQTFDCRDYAIIEFEHRYPEGVQRSCLFLVPCAHAFGNPEAQGCVAHRIAFFRKDASSSLGKLQIEDYGAESMSLKRVLENKAGNLQSFNRGMSYIAQAPQSGISL